MLVKFFARGKGGGRGPVEYITRKNYPGTNKLRYPAPEVLKGNPVITRRLIDSVEFKHKYNSGVLSFAPEDAPTEEQIEDVIDSFERYAFAGLNKDAYNILWVKHTHTGNNRVELHFVTPRVELYTGKSLNIAPPGWHGYFKPWQTSLNISQGWARPDEPTRKRTVEPGYMALINADREAKGLEPIKDTRQLLTEYVLSRVEAGLISDRHDIIELFKEELGLEITRAGSDYITVLDPDTDKRYRLKGKLYEREFRPEPEITAEARPRASSNSKVDTKELLEVTERIKSNYQSRAEYHRERYAASTVNTELDAGQVLVDSSGSRVESLSGYQYRQLGSSAILVESDRTETGDIGLSRREDRFSGNRDKTAATDFRKDTAGDSRSNDKPNGQRNIPDSAPWLNSDSWLAMSGFTLSEIGVKDERTGKQTNDRFREVSRSVQAGHDEFVSQVQYGHEAVREAESAARSTGDGFKRTSQELERANRETKDIQQQIDFNLHRIRRSLKQKKAKQLERFKTKINLVEYAMSYGYELKETKSTHNKAILHHDSEDKIVVVTDTGDRGLYFSFKNDWDKGTIIDFIQHRSELNLGEVRKELRPWLNQSDKAIAKPQPMSDERISLIQEFLEFSVLTNHPYLAKLGISNSTLNDEKFIGRIAVDEGDNVIFPHYDDDGISGYSIVLKNERDKREDGILALWKSNSQSDDRRLVITSNAIDALSYHQLFPHKHTRYISIEGTLTDYQKELMVNTIAELSHAENEVIIATGHDEKNILAFLADNHVRVKLHQPENTGSWNECLQMKIKHDKTLLYQAKQKSKQNKPRQLEP